MARVTDAPPRVYLVDDDLAVVRMLERVLTEDHAVRVVGRVGDGAAAEKEIQVIQPDIVVMDLLLPGQDGIETMVNVRRRGFAGTFIMLSNVSDKRMVARAYEAGIEFFIHKPLNRVEILSVVYRVSTSFKLQRTLRQVAQVLSPMTAAPPGTQPSHSRAARQVLADLGILGAAAAQDLQALAELGPEGPVTLQDLYARLEHHYALRHPGRAPGVRTIEQRIRRSALSALRHLATLGLEDFGNPQFERLAGRFFDLGEVRVAMDQVRKGKPVGGRLNLKKFVEAFLLEVDLQIHSTP